jgi:nitrite reductase/ring-hydroxylating ferredoxin subunit
MSINRRMALRVAMASATAAIFGSSTAAQASSKRIVRLSKVKVGGSHKFQLANGAPALLFRTKAGVFAYQTICTHQGGNVSYLAAGKLMVCEVHYASFNPFAAGKVVKGPTGSSASSISPLPRVKVKVLGAWIVLS